MKNMYIILSILVIIIFFYFISPFSLGFIESFTAVNEYKYLAPLPAGTTWSQDTITQLIEKTKDKYSSKNNPESMEDEIKKFITTWNITEEEGKYYIKNGTWPYDNYVLNYAKQNPDILSRMPKQDDGSPQTVSNLSKNWTNRIFYSILIGPIESKQTPQPLSYQIFMGTVPDPSSSQNKTSETISPITSSSLSSASTLSEANYNDLVGLCKNIMPV